MDLPPFLRHAYYWVDEGKDPRFLRSEHVRRQERAAQGREKRKAEEDAADAVNDLKRTNKSLQGKLLLADVQGCGYALEAVAAREEAEHEKKQKNAAHLKLKRTRSALAQLTSVKGTMSATADPELQRALYVETRWLCYTAMGDDNGMCPDLIKALLDIAEGHASAGNFKDVDVDVDAKEEGEGTRKQVILKDNLKDEVREVTFLLQGMLGGAGYSYVRGVFILKGGSSRQNIHNDAGVPGFSLSVLVALTNRRFTVCLKTGEMTLDLKPGDVVIFNTNVFHRGEANEAGSYAMFFFFDLANSDQDVGYKEMFGGSTEHEDAKSDVTGWTWEQHCARTCQSECIRQLRSVHEVTYWLYRDLRQDTDILNTFSGYNSTRSRTGTK